MFLQVRRFGSDVGIFPEIEETIPDERCVYGPGTFMYRAHGKLLFFATHFTAMCTPYLSNRFHRSTYARLHRAYYVFEVSVRRKLRKIKTFNDYLRWRVIYHT